MSSVMSADFGKDFDGHVALQLGFSRAIDLSHSARSK